MFRLSLKHDPQQEQHGQYKGMRFTKILPTPRITDIEDDDEDDPCFSDPCDTDYSEPLEPQASADRPVVVSPVSFGLQLPCEIVSLGGDSRSSYLQTPGSAGCELKGVACPLGIISNQPDYDGLKYMFDGDAFNEALESDYRILHETEGHVLGRRSAGTADMWRDSAALYFRCTPPDTSWFADLRESISRGDITSASVVCNSINYTIERRMDQRVKVIHNVNLHSVRVCAFGRSEGVEIVGGSKAASSQPLTLSEARERLVAARNSISSSDRQWLAGFGVQGKRF